MTRRRVFDVIEEPHGEVLRRLIRALGRYSCSATLVLRDDFDLGDTGRALLVRLQPHLIERKRSPSWPGTNLLSEEATVLRFALNEAVIKELIGASEGLYDWQQPSLPEDLALQRDDGTAILASICHERDAFLEVTDEELGTLAESIPELAGMVRPHTEG